MCACLLTSAKRIGDQKIMATMEHDVFALREDEQVTIAGAYGAIATDDVLIREGRCYSNRQSNSAAVAICAVLNEFGGR